MLNDYYKKKLKADHKKPERRPVTICPYCQRPVFSSDPDAEYIKTRQSEHYFHRVCLEKALRKAGAI